MDEYLSNVSKDIDRNVFVVTRLCQIYEIVPQGAEFSLQSGKGVLNVELGEYFQGLRLRVNVTGPSMLGIGIHRVPTNGDAVGK